MGEEELPPQESTNEGEQPASTEELRHRRRIVGISLAIGILFITLLVVAIIYLLDENTNTQKIRDIFIILMGLETFILGLALIILIVQLARLINLLQNEIKPILDSTNETVNTLKGTTTFLSNNLIEPVLKLNEYLAGLKELFGLISLTRRKNK